MGGLLDSFLGDGANAPMAATQVTDILGADKVGTFAAEIGTTPETATSALSDALPELLDKVSSGGKLLEGLAGDDAGDLLGSLKKLF
ncbi:MAG: hypothetical protein D6754_11550 [Alphaproteobacteria bacterium]|nr:MAG: hypothetical protein D6754_11550 [Alphaproteobacteria bacterium]